MKSFNVPVQYRSPLVTAIKQKRKAEDKMKKDFNPAILELGSLQIVLARHFGFCYGVENAIEIAHTLVLVCNEDHRAGVCNACINSLD